MGAAQIATFRQRFERLRRNVEGDSGFGIIELLMAMVVMTIAIGSLIAVFSASALSLHRSAERGTAVALAEGQMELYRTLPFTGIRVDGTLIPTSATDTYVSGHTADSSIPPSTGQALAGANGDAACPSTDFPAACYPVQTVTGPDGAHQFLVDTYVNYVNDDGTLSIRTPAAGLTLKRVTVVVRDAATKTIFAEDSSAFEGP